MDMSMLLTLQNRHRPLPNVCSKPFIVKNHIHWFNYCLEKKGETISATVTGICSVDEKQVVTLRKKMILQSLDMTRFAQPEMSEQEYYSLLEADLFAGRDTDFSKVLPKAEIPALLPVYKAVAEFIQVIS